MAAIVALVRRPAFFCPDLSVKRRRARVAARGALVRRPSVRRPSVRRPSVRRSKAKVAAQGAWKKKAREESQCGFGAEPYDESASFEREETQSGFDAAPCDECPKDHVRRVLVGFGLVELRSLYKLNIEELFLRI